MRILQVMAGGKHGGAETAFVDMCVALQQWDEKPQHNIQIEVITRPNDVRVPRLKQAGLIVHELPFGGALDLYTPYKIRQIIKQFKPDVIQSWMSRAPYKVPAWSPSMGVPRYVHLGRMGTPYKLKYFKSCDAFVSITPDIVTHITDHNVPQHRVREINNFAEVESPTSDLKRSDYGIPDDATVLLGLGRLHDDKAFDVLIRAVAKLPPHIYAWIAGEGPLRAELEALIAAENVTDRVKLLGWQSDRASLFAQSDICAFISRDEGFGTVFVQSWALKTPVIVSLADGPRQFVRDEEDGLTVPIDDVDATIAAINKLDQDKDLQQKLVDNGFDRYQAGFTKSACLDRYITYYNELLSELRSETKKTS